MNIIAGGMLENSVEASSPEKCLKDKKISGDSKVENERKKKKRKRPKRGRLSSSAGRDNEVKDAAAAPAASLEEMLQKVNGPRSTAKTSHNDSSSNVITSSESLTHLLVQGLQSNNFNMLESVLSKTNDAIINSTVSQLPVQMISPLVRELRRQICMPSQSKTSFIIWLQSVIRHHSSYLVNSSEFDDLINPIDALVEAKIEIYPRLLQLQGRLQHITAQLAIREKPSDAKAVRPNLLFNDDSSSDEDIRQEDVLIPSEMEDAWDGMDYLDQLKRRGRHKPKNDSTAASMDGIDDSEDDADSEKSGDESSSGDDEDAGLTIKLDD